MAQKALVDNKAARDRDSDIINDNVPSYKATQQSEQDTEGAESGSSSGDDKVPECAVCLQTCIHPVQLPCSHIFCFLCVKGVANQSKRCALCRSEIPVDFLNNPRLMRREDLLKEYTCDDGSQWFYEGRNGWWQYDERTSQEMEDKYKANAKTFEILIAGFLYVIDLESMIQYRRNDPTRRRRVKRDASTVPKKGVAGLKYNGEADSETSSIRDGADGNDLLVDSRDHRAITHNPIRACLNAPGSGGDIGGPRAPNNTPQSPEDGSPGEPSSPTHEDITATIANLTLTTTSRRHLPRHHRHLLNHLENGQPRTTQLPQYGRTARIRLLDTPSSSSDSDWD